MDLLIPLNGRHEPLYRQIYQSLRARILSGALDGGKRVPSSRDLADQLNVSRTVVLLAYEQLEAEGYLVGRSGSGTYVSRGLAGEKRVHAPRAASRFELSRFGAFAAERAAQPGFVERSAPEIRYDFTYGDGDLWSFPFARWRRVLMRHAGARPHAPADESGKLREALCAHLRRSRGVVSDPAQVLIVNSPAQALDLVARVLIERGHRMAIEDPVCTGMREVLNAAGAHVTPVPVDGDGLMLGRLPSGARAVFVTPHQFPTGAILSLARRRALLDWAARENALIIEDDYDAEFGCQEQRIECLQGLDSDGRVIYIGSFCSTIFPTLRLAYLIVPQALIGVFSAAKRLCECHSGSFEQEALAELITSGLYERHLRRVRRRNVAARTVLLEAVHTHLGERVAVTGDGAGAHLVLWLEEGVSEEAVIAAAAARGVRVAGVSRYFAERAPRPGILLGYSRLREAAIRDGIKQLGAAIPRASVLKRSTG
ncbi:MAG TPA: PLP-dependent aminotransferase family protein [Steroidobacteraceae bacterium]|nr:PLP-dependent aminotransferase family protein [Steroidobacteraceae bacterium]